MGLARTSGSWLLVLYPVMDVPVAAGFTQLIESTAGSSIISINIYIYITIKIKNDISAKQNFG